MLRALAFSSCLATLTAAAFSQSAPIPASRCTGLGSLKMESAQVLSASLVIDQSALAGLKLKPSRIRSLKEFCRVTILDKPSPDSEIATEVWLPTAGWNGRYRATGNGGFAGNIDYNQMAAIVNEGYVTSGTDTGHTGDGAEFSLGHPEKVKDFGWRSIHDMAVLSKQVVTAFYGRAALHSYFTACSDGGREALMEAQRFPTDFDGILAGAPAYNWTALVAAGTVNTKALSTPEGFISARKLPAIADAVRAQCDSLDGVKDGVLNDPRACSFNPEVIACKHGDAENCLMPGQIATLKTIYAAKKDHLGAIVFPGYLPGAEDASGSWNGWVTTADPTGQSALKFFGKGFFGDMVHQQPDWTIRSFNFDADLQLARQKTSAAIDAVDPNLAPFAARGSRIILYHGWNDPAIPALSSIAYYDALNTSMGPEKVDESVRLYMVPGLLHCSGGSGASAFGQDPDTPRSDTAHDIVTALEGWVETNKAPGPITAVGGGMTRPVCVYPEQAKYLGGDTKSAASFSCTK